MQQSLEDRFWVVAKVAAGDEDLQFTWPCATIVRDLLRAGVRNMQRQGRDSDQDILEAEANVTRMVKHMALETRRLNERAIREKSFIESKKACPVWPFC